VRGAARLPANDAKARLGVLQHHPDCLGNIMSQLGAHDVQGGYLCEQHGFISGDHDNVRIRIQKQNNVN